MSQDPKQEIASSIKGEAEGFEKSLLPYLIRDVAGEGLLSFSRTRSVLRLPATAYPVRHDGGHGCHAGRFLETSWSRRCSGRCLFCRQSFDLRGKRMRAAFFAATAGLVLAQVPGPIAAEQIWG
jgi:hypothetical protein